MMDIVTIVVLILAVIIAGWGQPKFKGQVKTSGGAIMVIGLYLLWVLEVIALAIIAVWSQQ
ncbi:hypothetical protein DRQ25_05190 [Candidatus Fermentibacteria bacterium]|nr:MAG: hypothetical protein DRQ25_05190 [Candidatus Fermentibacteria bacterium]